ncbi:MAG: YihY/virulence factor BrkB family protein [bacterium]
MTIKNYPWKSLIKKIFTHSFLARITSHSAALAFYFLLSLAPMIIIIINLVGIFFTEDKIQSQIMEISNYYLGNQGMDIVEKVFEYAEKPGKGLSTLFGGLTIIFGASFFFNELQQNLNIIWKLPQSHHNTIKSIIKAKLKPFLLVVAAVIISFSSLFLITILPLANKILHYFNMEINPNWAIFTNLITFVMLWLLFMAIFKILPNARFAWRHVWIGALVTALLFTAGQAIIHQILQTTTTTSMYGATGSLIFVLLWIYYSSLIFLFGGVVTYSIQQISKLRYTQSNQKA